jgi:hypothetical protein
MSELPPGYRTTVPPDVFPRARDPFEDSTTLRSDEQAEFPHSVGSLSMARKRVYDVVGACFPEILEETIACLSTAATLLLADQQNPAAVNLEGPPSSQKTTLIDFFAKAGNKVYRSDKFTPKSFVSHAASVQREKLNEIDLLPRIRHRLFLIPELAPLFGLRNEDLLENFSILTRVFDGHGLSTDSGIHGQRGHVGDYLFAWIGCTTPIEHRVWKTMGKLGSRLLFLEMPNDEQRDEQLVSDVAGGVSYRDRVARCAEAVADFLDVLWVESGGVRAVDWNRADDPNDLMLKVAKYAKALAALRGTISVWREGSGDDESYNFSTPIIEQPHRAMSLLYALARGHALVHGRRQLSEEDLPIVARAALESTPNDRRAVIRILLANAGTATTTDVEKALRCSAPTARAILETLDHLGVGSFENPGPPVTATLVLADWLRWILVCPAADPLKKKRRRGGNAHSSTGSEQSAQSPASDPTPPVADRFCVACTTQSTCEQGGCEYERLAGHGRAARRGSGEKAKES